MASASSTFDNTENPLSEAAAWVSGPGALTDVQKVSGQVRVVTEATNAGARYVGTTFAGDHSSEITLGSGFPTAAVVFIAAATRMQGNSDGSCYIAFTQGENAIGVYRIADTGSIAFNQLGGNFTGLLLAAGTRVRLESVGSTHEVFVNDVSIGTRSDGTLTGGAPGIVMVAEAGNGARDLITAWSAADLGSSNVTDQVTTSSYAITVQTATDKVTDTAGAASYAITAQVAVDSVTDTASAASYAITPAAAVDLVADAAVPAAFVIAAQAAADRVVDAAAPAAYAITVQNATDLLGTIDTVETVAYLITPQPALEIIRDTVGVAAYLITPKDATDHISGGTAPRRDLRGTTTPLPRRKATITRIV